MTDQQIIDLYFARSERAIQETHAQYGRYCYQIAYNILHIPEDSEECLSDTYLSAWNRIPPTRPSILSVYLARITRSLSIDRWRSSHSLKRGGGQLPLAIHELDGALGTGEDLEEQTISAQMLNTFLRSLPVTERDVFLCRYWYLDSIRDIARDFGFSESKVKSMLLRTRRKLKDYLTEGGMEP